MLCIPSVRRLAKEHSLDLTAVSGTGKHGRILKEDVLKYLEEPKRPAPSKTPTILRNNEKAPDELQKVEPIKGFTKAMFKTMTEALVRFTIYFRLSFNRGFFRRYHILATVTKSK